MSPVKAHKSAVKQEHSLPAKKAVSFLLQILSEFFIKDFLLPFLRNVFYTRNQNMEHYCNWSLEIGMLNIFFCHFGIY